jgi:hypothetical protein
MPKKQYIYKKKNYNTIIKTIRLEEDQIKNCDAEYAPRHLTETQPSLCSEGVLPLGLDNS